MIELELKGRLIVIHQRLQRRTLIFFNRVGIPVFIALARGDEPPVCFKRNGTVTPRGWGGESIERLHKTDFEQRLHSALRVAAL